MRNQMANQSENRASDQTVARHEAQKQWEANPCSADTVVGCERESLEWFRAARRVRYEVGLRPLCGEGGKIVCKNE
jgi:hypothetical protein